MKKISTSADAKLFLLITLFALWALIQALIVFIFNEAYFLPGTFIFLVIMFFSLKPITGKVKTNEAHVLLDSFSKKNRVMFQGFYWKLPWETIDFLVDLEGVIDSDITETFPTSDGSISATVSIMSKPDSGSILNLDEVGRSKKIINYIKYTPAAIKGIQEACAKKAMRERFARCTSEGAKSLGSEQILNRSDFCRVAEEISIRVIECPVKDVDYNEEIQHARNAVGKAHALAAMVEALKTSGYTPEEAKAIAPLLDKDINLKKQINDVNFNGLSMPPELIKAISSLIKKFGG